MRGSLGRLVYWGLIGHWRHKRPRSRWEFEDEDEDDDEDEMKLKLMIKLQAKLELVVAIKTNDSPVNASSVDFSQKEDKLTANLTTSSFNNRKSQKAEEKEKENNGFPLWKSLDVGAS